MAAAVPYSTLLTNTYANPPVANRTDLDGPTIKRCVGQITYTQGDTAANTTTYNLCRVRSNDMSTSILINWAALGATATMKLGLTEPWLLQTTPIPGGAGVPGGPALAVTANLALFASAIVMTTASGPTQERFAVLGVTTTGQRIWELLGLTSDPQREWDLTLTLTVVGTTTGQVGFEYQYNT